MADSTSEDCRVRKQLKFSGREEGKEMRKEKRSKNIISVQNCLHFLIFHKHIIPGVCSCLWVAEWCVSPEGMVENGVFSQPGSINMYWKPKTVLSHEGENYRIAVDYNNFSKASNLYIRLA